MNNIILNNIKIKNFMGIASGEYDFKATNNTISSQSGEGKTSIRKSYLWALGQKVDDYIPKIKDSNKISVEVLMDLDIEVTINLTINNKEYEICRKASHDLATDPVTMEKKYKGTSANKFSINGVNYSNKQFDKELENLLNINVEQFIVFLDIEYFSNDTNKWNNKTRREFILKPIENEVQKADENLLKESKYEYIKEQIESGKTVEQITEILRVDGNAIRQQQRTNKDLYENYNDEVAKLSSVDYLQYENQLEELLAEKANISDIKTVDVTKEQAQLSELYKKLSGISINRSKFDSKKVELDNIINKGNRLKAEIEEQIAGVDWCTTETKKYEKQITEIEESKYNGDNLCPTCQQKLPVDMINECIKTFEETKKNELNNYIDKKDTYNKKIVVCDNNIKELKKSKDALGEKYYEIKAELDKLPSIKDLEVEYDSINNDIKTLNAKIELKKSKANKNTNPNDILELEEKIKDTKQLLKGKTNKEFLQGKIKEIIESNKSLANNEMSNNQHKATVKEYNTRKMNVLSKVVEKYFANSIKFALYDYQPSAKDEYNEYIETCYAVFNGKPYSALSAGEKVHCNYLLQLGLQKMYDLNFTIWLEDYEIDQRPLEDIEQQRILIRNDNVSKLGIVKIKDLYQKEEK